MDPTERSESVAIRALVMPAKRDTVELERLRYSPLYRDMPVLSQEKECPK